MNAIEEQMKAKARENYAFLNTEYSEHGGVRQVITAWRTGTDGRILLTFRAAQLRGEIYESDWLFHACRCAAEMAEQESGGRPWTVIQTVMGCTGPACVVCNRGNME